MRGAERGGGGSGGSTAAQPNLTQHNIYSRKKRSQWSDDANAKKTPPVAKPSREGQTTPATKYTAPSSLQRKDSPPATFVVSPLLLSRALLLYADRDRQGLFGEGAVLIAASYSIEIEMRRECP